jgi:hypothetical protein
MLDEEGKLTDEDHANMDAFLGLLLDDYKNGLLTRATAIGTLGHIIAAVDIGNHAEAINWFKNGRQFLNTQHSKTPDQS